MEYFDFSGMVIVWIPILLLIAVWFFLARKYNPSRRQQTAFQAEILEETRRQTEEKRRQNELLQRIATALEKRAS